MSATSDLAHGYPPERLVPGDPGAVLRLGDALAGYADLLADAAHALSRVEVEWDGAAAGRFREEFALQPGRFTAAAAAFDTACSALGRYAATLLSAQLAAVRARDLFAEGLRAAAAVVGGPLGVDAGPLDLLTSPAGREQRLAAVELLERVRVDVDRAGNEAAETLRGAMASAPEPVSAWQHAWNFLLAPPWEINQERRDWAAGAVVGSVETLVLASAPLPDRPVVARDDQTAGQRLRMAPRHRPPERLPHHRIRRRPRHPHRRRCACTAPARVEDNHARGCGGTRGQACKPDS